MHDRLHIAHTSYEPHREPQIVKAQISIISAWVAPTLMVMNVKGGKTSQTSLAYWSLPISSRLEFKESVVVHLRLKRQASGLAVLGLYIRCMVY